MSSLTRLLPVLVLLSIGAGGCGDLKARIEEALEKDPGTGQGSGSAPVDSTGKPVDVGGKGGLGGEPSCAAVTNADGTVCKQCVDASGAIVHDSCAPTGTGGGTGGGDTPGTGTDGSCIKISDGGPTSCKDAATWKRYGTDACAQQKLTLTDIAWGAACGDNFETVVYVCCGVAPDTGAGPTTCSVSVDAATGVTCKTCTDAAGVVIASDCSPTTK